MWYKGYYWLGDEDEDEEVESVKTESPKETNPVEVEPPCHCSPLWHNGVVGHDKNCKYFKWKTKKEESK